MARLASPPGRHENEATGQPVNKTFLSYYKIIGLEPRVVEQMNYKERAVLSLLMIVNTLFLVFVGVSLYFSLVYIFNWNITLTIVLIYLFFVFYVLTTRQFVINYLNRGRTTWDVQIVKVVLFLVLLSSAIGMSIYAGKDEIARVYKEKLYSKANAEYISEMRKINIMQQNELKQNRENFVKGYLPHKDTIIWTPRSIEILKTNLQKSINENLLKLNFFYFKKGEPKNIDSLPDTIEKNKFTGEYPTDILSTFIKAESDSVNSFNGILFESNSFNPSNDIKIIENYNDSIYQASQKLIFLNAAYQSLDSLLASSPHARPKGLPNLDAIAPVTGFAVSNKSWLRKLVTIERRNIPPSAKIGNYGYLLIHGNSTVLARTLLIFVPVIAFFINLLILLSQLKRSSYTKMVQLYRKSEALQLDDHRKKLEEKDSILSDITTKTKDGVTEEEKKAFTMLKNDGSFESYVGYANYYVQRKQYNNALEWLEDGYAKFNTIPEYQKRSLELLKSMEEVYLFAGNWQKAKIKKEEYETVLNALTVVENMSRKLSIDKLEVTNHHFYENINWELQPGMNVLLGKNGYGKSHLLSIFLAILQNNYAQATSLINSPDLRERGINFLAKLKEEKEIRLTPAQEAVINAQVEETVKKIRDEHLANEPGESIEEKIEFEELLHQVRENERQALIRKMDEDKLIVRYTFNTESDVYEIKTAFGKIPLLAIPDSRFINKSNSQISKAVEETDIAKNGAWHFIYQIPYSSIIENFYFDTCTEIYEKKQNSFGVETEDLPAVNIIKKVYERLTGIKITKLEVTKQTLAVYEMFVTTDDLVERLPIQKVSQGTFSIISIVGTIFTYLKFIYKDKVTPEKYTEQPAIIIIDEVDAHLHPMWQQKIVNILKDVFPRVQFIITAHSPFIVAGCKQKEVSILQKRSDSKKYYLTQFNQHFIGYSPDELTKQIFEIEKYDENYRAYVNQTPKKKKIKEDIAGLQSESNKDPKKKEKLEELTLELYMIESAEKRWKELQNIT